VTGLTGAGLDVDGGGSGRRGAADTDRVDDGAAGLHFEERKLNFFYQMISSSLWLWWGGMGKTL